MSAAIQAGYREVAVGGGLVDAAVCGWWDVVDAPRTGTVVPDGCIDLICRVGGEPFVVGPMTRATHPASEAGTTWVGIRLRPGRAAGRLGVDAYELRDRQVPAADLLGVRVRHLGEQVAAVARPDLGVGLLDAALAALPRRPVGHQDLLVAEAVALLGAHPPIAVAEAARTVGVSPRHLHRAFLARVGYGPKTYQRIARFQRLLRLAEQAPRTPLVVLAAHAGYADQPHMSRDVRRLTGAAPTAALADPHAGLHPQVTSGTFTTGAA